MPRPHVSKGGLNAEPSQITERPPPPPPSALPPKPADPARTVSRNGVVLDLESGRITHRGRTAVIIPDEGIRLVGALARVMPALLDTSRLVAYAFVAKLMDGPDRLRSLVEEINPTLRQARLEIKTVPKMGNTLYDLGPG